jgi:cytochrome b involved in lipid metabolism
MAAKEEVVGKEFSEAEIKKHSSDDDLWIILHGYVPPGHGATAV